MSHLVQKLELQLNVLIQHLDKLQRYQKWLVLGSITTITCTIARSLYISYSRRKRQSPPGLHGIPFFGSLFTMAFWSGDFYVKLLPKYGPITSHFVGKQEFITIHDKNLIQTIFSHDCCINRPSNHRIVYIGTQLTPSIIGVNNSENGLWLRRRNILKQAIGKLDNVSSNMNENVGNNNGKRFVSFVDSQVGKLLKQTLFVKMDNACKNKNSKVGWKIRYDIKHFINILSWNMIFSDKYTVKTDDKNYNEHVLEKINHQIEKIFELGTIAVLANLFPSIGIEKLLLYQIQKNFRVCCKFKVYPFVVFAFVCCD